MHLNAYLLFKKVIPKDLKLERSSDHLLKVYGAESLALEHLTKIHEKVLLTDSVKLIHRIPNVVKFLVTKEFSNYKIGDEVIYTYQRIRIEDKCDDVRYV